MRISRKKTCIILAASIIFFIYVESSRAETIGSVRKSSWSSGWAGQPAGSIQFGIEIFDDLNPNDRSTRIFLGNVTESDIGRTFIYSTDSPQFTALKTHLSNGINESLMFFWLYPDGSGPGLLFPESTVQKYYGSGPDFSGYQIQDISMKINDFILQYPYNGNQNYVQFDCAVSFNGIIPEPATILLFGLGAAILRKKK